MVPEPLLPEIGGSSPKCKLNADIFGFIPILQKPNSFFRRLTLQFRGQQEHLSRRAEKFISKGKVGR